MARHDTVVAERRAALAQAAGSTAPIAAAARVDDEANDAEREHARLDDAQLAGVLDEQQHSRGVNAAAHAFTATLAIAPGYLEAYNNLAAAYEKLARFEESSAVLNRALALQPGASNPAHVFLGDMELNVGNVAAAQSVFETARRLQPSRVAGHVESGHLSARRARLAAPGSPPQPPPRLETAGRPTSC